MNHQEELELLTSLRQRLTIKYQYFIDHCDPVKIDAKWIKGFLKLAETAIDECQTEGVSPAEIDRVRVNLRNSAGTILKHAEWLDRSSREQLNQFIQSQPQYIGGKFCYSADLFSWNIAQWQKDLARFVALPSLNFLEIGSFEGQSTCWLLTNLLTQPDSKITCIDPFLEDEYFSLEGYYDLSQNSSKQSLSQRFDHNIRQTSAHEKVIKIIGYSYQELRKLPFDHFDFIYIDGSHIAKDVLEDAVLAWRLLKITGLLTFDDYMLRGHADPMRCPTAGVDAFLKLYQGQYRLIHKAYQVTIEKLV